MTTPPAPTGLEPTQTRRPWRATIRTVFAVGIPALLLLPTVFEILVEELGGNLPPRATEWLLIAGAFVTALAAVITRILALAPVELFLRGLPGAALAAQPRPKPTDRDDAGAVDLEGIIRILAFVLIAVLVIWALLALVGGVR